MASLDRGLRKDLENTVKAARKDAEQGAKEALAYLGVSAAEAPKGVDRGLRNRLRAHGRQLGDRLDEGKGTQPIERLAAECAYEHWHRLLFARFLAENDLLVEPVSGMPLSLGECQELAREQGKDWLLLASEFAQRMLPQIFRAGDPVLDVALPPERRQKLETLLAALPREVFLADDSLGWVYQFWQSEEKERVNKSEKKIGADELPAVTQLFTEDYMVLFLLHNTLGAWWAGKVLAKKPAIARTAATEEALRRACALPGMDWEYLRFVKSEGEEGEWRPAAGTFDGWPKAARDVTVLDPCMGSGHFLVFALPILVALRTEEEGLSREAAVDGVLRDNLFGLEIDPRCTQIAAFNLALAAWRMVGHRALPKLNLACSGLSPSARKADWVTLAGGNYRLQNGMESLFKLFEQAPVLGSLLDPRAEEATLLEAGFEDLAPLLEQAMARESENAEVQELAVKAAGITKAAAILARSFTLVATNVPYLGRGKQNAILKEYCERVHGTAKADLSTCFVERSLKFCASAGTVALVTPQNWLFLGTYQKLRRRLLENDELNFVTRLGANAFRDMNWWAATTALISLSRRRGSSGHQAAGLDITKAHEPQEKAVAARDQQITTSLQAGQARNPDARFSLDEAASVPLLREYADCLQGTTTGDNPRHVCTFWELGAIDRNWEPFQASVDRTQSFGGRHDILRWEQGHGELAKSAEARIQGHALFNRSGVFVGQMGQLPVTSYSGEFFNMNGAALVPRDADDLPAIWAFCSSAEFCEAVRVLDQALKVTNATIVKVPFDRNRWRQTARELYPQGLTRPQSSDSTQWLFFGAPKQADQPLQVATARLLGYRWPRQTGSSFMDAPAISPDGLEKHADEDGIVCLMPLQGEPAAADRLRALLADAFGSEWSAGKLSQLLEEVGYQAKTLEDWLRDGFFEQHCELFHQRPFVWHLWDGRRDGFNALVNYHKLAAPDGEGRRTLEKLIYSYLGDWIDRQRAEQSSGVEGADGRLASAQRLRTELMHILEGEPPYDLFVRWKPLHQQAVGWDPDINDGVRLNIRPFMNAKPLAAKAKNACILRTTPKIKWDKDRGKEPYRLIEDFPWFWTWDGATSDFRGGTDFDGNRWNDLHYTRTRKLEAQKAMKKGASR